MSEDLKSKCEDSFYSELYHFEEASQDLVLDKTTGRVMLRKTLETYDIAVYRWLRDNHHPNIPAIYSIREMDGCLTVLEEYIQGSTLEEEIGSGNMSYDMRSRAIMDVCSALIFLHDAPIPIIHRDVKPSNIMLTSDGMVKLIDYDAAKTYHAGKEKDTTLIGTVGAAAPEQYGFAQSDKRTDIYSLGVLIRQLFPDDGRYARIIGKATRLDPKDRYQRVSDLRKDILRVNKRNENGYDKALRIATALAMATTLALIVVVIIFIRLMSTKLGDSSQSIQSETETAFISESYDETDNADKESMAVSSKSSKCDTDTFGITESCWYLNVPEGSEDAYIHYAVIVYNPSGSNTVEFPAVNVTVKDSSGNVIGSDEMVGSYIMPDDSIALTSLASIPASYSDENISVDFNLGIGKQLDSTNPAPRSSDFYISGITENKSSLFPSVSGEIRNDYPEDVDTVAVTAILRNKGGLVEAATSYVDNLSSGSTRGFTIDLSDDVLEHDSVEVMAQSW